MPLRCDWGWIGSGGEDGAGITVIGRSGGGGSPWDAVERLESGAGCRNEGEEERAKGLEAPVVEETH